MSAGTVESSRQGDARAERIAAWVLHVDHLFAQRPELVGIYAPADITLESIKASA